MTDVKELIQHRKPFLFVDELTRADEKGVEGYRLFTEEDFFFKGHFPGYPVVPGVILVETMAQCGGAGIKEAGLIDSHALFFLGTVDKVKFRHQVRPGDRVDIVVENVKVSSRVIKQRGKAMVDSTVAAEAEWLCILDPGDKQEEQNKHGN